MHDTAGSQRQIFREAALEAHRRGEQRGRPLHIVSTWTRLAVAASRRLGLRPPVEPALVGYLRHYWFLDDSKARRELGYGSRPARAILEPAVHWVQAQLLPAETAAGAAPARRTMTAVEGRRAT